MKIPIGKDEEVQCPRKDGPEDLRICKACYWLGWAAAGKVVCRWTQEKEELIRGDRYYEVSNL